jgi:uncharacterized protein UPF0164
MYRFLAALAGATYEWAMHPARRLAALCAVLAVAAALRARADDSNFRPYVVGGRAAGMGGAFTALSDDGSGPYYNPGGLAFVRRSQLSLSGSVYGVVAGTQADAHTATDVGINVSYGSGTDLVPNNLDFSDLKPTESRQLLFYVFLASAYEF